MSKESILHVMTRFFSFSSTERGSHGQSFLREIVASVFFVLAVAAIVAAFDFFVIARH